MPTRHYFKKAIEPAPKPPKVRRPSHKGKVVLVEVKPGLYRAMKSSDYAMMLGRSKGGLTAQSRGTAYKWDSESASKASKKLWKTRYRLNTRLGIRLGRPAKLRPSIDRNALRLRYYGRTDIDIMYTGILANGKHCWCRQVEGKSRVISERQALTILGHLGGISRFVSGQKPIPLLGRGLAGQEGTKETV